MKGLPETTGRKSSAEWQSLMDAYEAGDLSQREFCRRRGLAYSTFGYWRRRLRSAEVHRQNDAGPLVELTAMRMPEDTAPWRVEIDLGGGVRLRLR
jgi:hypothetical protein